LVVGSSVPCVRRLDRFEPNVSLDIQDDGSPEHRLGQKRQGVILPIFDWMVRRIDRHEAEESGS